MEDESRDLDVMVIGGGQAGLAVGWYLRRTALRWAILDAQDRPGGAWQHAWRSLRLFSPARYSSLPGWMFPAGDEYPTREQTLDYLARYEARYALGVRRPVRVCAVHRNGGGFRAETDVGEWRARAVVSATGTWAAPGIPNSELTRARAASSSSPPGSTLTGRPGMRPRVAIGSFRRESVVCPRLEIFPGRQPFSARTPVSR